jgi:hypothetical protein
MPFSTLDKNWSNLAQYYNTETNGKFSNPGNVTYTSKPFTPGLRYNTGDFDDGLIRGGAINAGISILKDTERVGKFFFSTKGILFTVKQLGLQQANPQLESEFPGTNSILDSTKWYSPLNTLIQVPVNAIGGHFTRHGLVPRGSVGFFNGSSQGNGGYNYEAIATLNNDRTKTVKLIGGNANRLVDHYSTIILNPSGQQNLLKYGGGAASVYGLGRTEINTTKIRTTFGDSLSDNLELKLNGFRLFSNIRINAATQADLNSTLANQLYNSPLYKNRVNAGDGNGNLETSYDIESRIGVSSGNKTTRDYDYVDGFAGDTDVLFVSKETTKYNVDSINVITVTDSKTFYDNSLTSNNDPKLPPWTLEKGNQNIDGKFGRDIIKFRFEFLNNDNPISGGAINTDVLAFRAYLDDFQDGMNAKWDSYRYMGRGEEFYVYNGFTRDISLAFTIYAHTPEEMAPIYKKLNYLLSTFTPDYSKNGKMRGNIGYLTVGDYLYRQPGVFTDIKLSGMLDTHWEIAYNGPEVGGVNQYEVPKHIKATLSFKPIHTFLPRKAQYKDGASVFNTPFVTIDKKAYPTQAGQRKNSKGEIIKDASNKYLD